MTKSANPEHRRGNKVTVAALGGVIAVMLVLVAFLVPLYRLRDRGEEGGAMRGVQRALS